MGDRDRTEDRPELPDFFFRFRDTGTPGSIGTQAHRLDEAVHEPDRPGAPVRFALTRRADTIADRHPGLTGLLSGQDAKLTR